MVTFSFVAMDQIVNQASKIRYMFGGQADFPVTYRCSTGGGIGLAAQHSQSPYSMWMHLAGLKIILPGDAGGREGPAEERHPRQQSRGLVRVQPARRDDGPRARRRPPGAARRVADVKRAGTDVTIVGLAYYVPEALAVAEDLARDGISVEVIDPRTLVPLDVETIRASVRKTGRGGHRRRGAAPQCSAASEISALPRRGPRDLPRPEGPIRRVRAAPVPVPYSPLLEQAALPNRESIKSAVYETLKEESLR